MNAKDSTKCENTGWLGIKLEGVLKAYITLLSVLVILIGISISLSISTQGSMGELKSEIRTELKSYEVLQRNNDEWMKRTLREMREDLRELRELRKMEQEATYPTILD